MTTKVMKMRLPRVKAPVRRRLVLKARAGKAVRCPPDHLGRTWKMKTMTTRWMPISRMWMIPRIKTVRCATMTWGMGMGTRMRTDTATMKTPRT